MPSPSPRRQCEINDTTTRVTTTTIMTCHRPHPRPHPHPHPLDDDLALALSLTTRATSPDSLAHARKRVYTRRITVCECMRARWQVLPICSYPRVTRALAYLGGMESGHRQALLLLKSVFATVNCPIRLSSCHAGLTCEECIAVLISYVMSSDVLAMMYGTLPTFLQIFNTNRFVSLKKAACGSMTLWIRLI